MSTRTRVRWDRIAGSLAFTAVLTAGAAIWGGQALDSAVPEPSVTVPPCVTEDDPGPCYWDADVRGNGMGRSFVVLDGVTYYLEGER